VFFVIAVLKQLLLLLTSQLYRADIDFFTTSISILLDQHATKTRSSFLSRKGAKTQSLFIWSGFSLLNVYLENYCPCPDIPETSKGNPFVSVKIAIRRPKRPEHLKASETGLNYSLKLNFKFPKLPCLPSSIRIQISKADPRLATYYICIKNTKTINPTNGCHFMKIYLFTDSKIVRDKKSFQTKLEKK